MPYYDVAILELDDSLRILKFSEEIGISSPVCLPKMGQLLDDQDTPIVAGWGTTSYGGESKKNTLQKFYSNI